MRCISRFNIMAFSAIFIAACTQRGEKNAIVTTEQYGSAMCWTDQDGRLSAFLVLAQNGKIAVPYLISTKCLVSGNYSSYGEGVLHHLNAVRLVDKYDILQRALPAVTLSNSTISDQPVPYPNSKMYYFRSIVRIVPDKYMMIYAPVDILQFDDMNTSFETFLNLSVAERQNLQVRKRDGSQR